MANTRRATGPSAQRVAANVHAIRRARGLDLSHLSERLSRIGQPVSVAGLSRLELGQRRVDVDDLVALALALDVSPGRLLLPPTPDCEEVQLAPSFSTTAYDAWEWVSGSAPPDDLWGSAGGVEHEVEWMRRWRRESAPTHVDVRDLSMREVVDHQDALDRAVVAVEAVEAEGMKRDAVIAYVQWKRHRDEDVKVLGPDRFPGGRISGSSAQRGETS